MDEAKKLDSELEKPRELEDSEKRLVESYGKMKVPDRFQDQIEQIETRVQELGGEKLLADNTVEKIKLPYAQEGEIEAKEDLSKSENEKLGDAPSVIDKTTKAEERQPFQEFLDSRDKIKPSAEKLNHQKIVVQLLERMKSGSLIAKARAGIVLRSMVKEDDAVLLGLSLIHI